MRKNERREFHRKNSLSRVAISFPPEAVFSSSVTLPSSRMRFFSLNKSARAGCIMPTPILADDAPHELRDEKRKV